MNSRTLQDILHGRYGRKVAYTDAEKITPDNIISVLGKCIGIFNLNKQRLITSGTTTRETNRYVIVRRLCVTIL